MLLSTRLDTFFCFMFDVSIFYLRQMFETLLYNYEQLPLSVLKIFFNVSSIDITAKWLMSSDRILFKLFFQENISELRVWQTRAVAWGNWRSHRPMVQEPLSPDLKWLGGLPGPPCKFKYSLLFVWNHRCTKI